MELRESREASANIDGFAESEGTEPEGAGSKEPVSEIVPDTENRAKVPLGKEWAAYVTVSSVISHVAAKWV